MLLCVFIVSIYVGYDESIKDILKEHQDRVKEVQNELYNQRNAHESEVEEQKKEHKSIVKKMKSLVDEAKTNENNALYTAEKYKKSLLEHNQGYPTLLKTIEEFEKIRDEYIEQRLLDKSRPAPKAAEAVREETKRRRAAELLYKRFKLIIEYYEHLYPELEAVKEDIFSEDDYLLLEETDDRDRALYYLSKEEYEELSTVEKYQLALDRFIERKKSKWLIGILYERYIGYLYEKKGYDVDFHGIQREKRDLGIDLICKKDNKVILVQCKNWSRNKTIYEKHIFQFFGTYFQYQHTHPSREVKAVFYTTTQLSDIARLFAKKLNVSLAEEFKFNQKYPCIKCNIGKDGEKIYHLPFDQQYDNIKIEVNKGEKYVVTVSEAERLGFRRALRWRGNSSI